MPFLNRLSSGKRSSVATVTAEIRTSASAANKRLSSIISNETFERYKEYMRKEDYTKIFEGFTFFNNENTVNSLENETVTRVSTRTNKQEILIENNNDKNDKNKFLIEKKIFDNLQNKEQSLFNAFMKDKKIKKILVKKQDNYETIDPNKKIIIDDMLNKDTENGIKLNNKTINKEKIINKNLYLKDMDEARDLTNEVFLKVYQKLSKFTSYNSFGGWLRTLTKNTAIDYLRHKTEDLVLDDSESGIEPIEPSSEDEQLVVDKITYDWIIKEMDTLPPLYRDVCLLYYKDNLTVKQISEAKNIPKGTVKSYLFRFRKKFNKKY